MKTSTGSGKRKVKKTAKKAVKKVVEEEQPEVSESSKKNILEDMYKSGHPEVFKFAGKFYKNGKDYTGTGRKAAIYFNTAKVRHLEMVDMKSKPQPFIQKHVAG